MRKGKACLYIAALLLILSMAAGGVSAADTIDVRFHVTPGAGLRAMKKENGSYGPHYAPFLEYPVTKLSGLDARGYEVFTGKMPASFFYQAGGVDADFQDTGFQKTIQRLNIGSNIDTSAGVDVTVDVERINPNRRDDYSPYWYADDVYFNVGNSMWLKSQKGSTFDIIPIRVWQTIEASWENYYFEPDYKVEVIGDTGAVEVEPAQGNTGRYYFTAKRVGDGVGVIKFTYGPIMGYWERSLGGTNYKPVANDVWQYWNAIDPANTGIVVMADWGPDTGISLRSEIDTVYFDGDISDHAEYSFTPPGSGEFSVRVHRPLHNTEWDEGWSDGRKNQDGSFTVDLYHGRNIVEVSRNLNGSISRGFHVINARPLKILVSNTSVPGWKRGDPLRPGDKLEVTFTGIQSPVQKLSGIYNAMGGAPTYTTPSGVIVQAVSGSQYGLVSGATAAVTVPESGVLSLTKGYVRVSWLGDPWGSHHALRKDSVRWINDHAVGVEMQACVLPDIILPGDSAALTGAAGQSFRPSGDGTIGNPGTAGVEVPRVKDRMTAADFTAAPGAKKALYADGDFTEETESIELEIGDGNHVYVKVTAENGETAQYYDITVARSSKVNDNASLVSIAGKSVTTSGKGKIGAPEATNIQVDSDVSAITASDIVPAPGALSALFSDSNFTRQAESIPLAENVPIPAYVKVTAEDRSTTAYYKISVTRAKALNRSAELTGVAGRKVTPVEPEAGEAGGIFAAWTASVTVVSGKEAIVPGDIAAAEGAAVELYPDSDFMIPTDSIPLAEGAQTHVYVRVSAEDPGVTPRYYDVTVTREAAVAETFGITLSASGTHAFPDAEPGYAAPAALGVSVTNSGNQGTGALSILLGGANPGSFALSGTSISGIDAGKSGSFSVAPKTGLAAGSYAATVTVSGDRVTARSFGVTFTVKAVSADAPVSPDQSGEPELPDQSGSDQSGEGGASAEVSAPAVKPVTQGVEAGSDIQVIREQSALPAGASDYTEVKDGVVVAKTDAVETGLSSRDAAALDLGVITPLPAFSAKVSAGGNTAVLTFRTKLDEFDGIHAGDIAVLKLKRDGSTVPLAQAASLAAITDGQYILTDSDGNEERRAIVAGALYSVNVAVRDNGDYDWNTERGRIADPVALAARSDGSPESGSIKADSASGGGCDSGAAWIALLLVTAALASETLARRRAQRKEG